MQRVPQVRSGELLLGGRTLNVYVCMRVRLDVPNTALDLLSEAADKFTCEPRIVLGMVG